ncbi:MAG: hypothetical protein ACR2KT_10685 [Methylocella sp.]
MAQKAMVRIVPGSKAIRIGMELREKRIDLALAKDRTAVRPVGTGIAGRFQLSGPVDSFDERDCFVDLNLFPGRWVGTDHRRGRNGNSSAFQFPRGVRETAAHPWIMWRTGWSRKQTNHCGEYRRFKKIAFHEPASLPDVLPVLKLAIVFNW